MYDTAKWLERVERIVLHTCSNQNFTVDWLAARLSLSPRQLQRRMKELTGMTPKKYITELRLQMAKTLLEEKKCKSIAQVTYEVGFQKNSYFVTLFTQRFQMRPKDLLNNSALKNTTKL